MGQYIRNDECLDGLIWLENSIVFGQDILSRWLGSCPRFPTSDSDRLLLLSSIEGANKQIPKVILRKVTWLRGYLLGQGQHFRKTRLAA